MRLRRPLRPLCSLALLALLPLAAAAEPPRRVVVESLGRLPAFSHATVTDDLIFVSGTLGTLPGGLSLVAGGVAEQTSQALRNIETILATQKASLADVAKCTRVPARHAGFRGDERGVHSVLQGITARALDDRRRGPGARRPGRDRVHRRAAALKT